MYYVYILERADGRYYIGQTNNVLNRLIRHQTGQVISTRPFRPVKLVLTESYGSRKEATGREKQLKTWKNRNALNQLINNSGGLIV